MNKSFFITRLSLILVLSLASLVTPPILPPPALAATDLPIYTDALTSGWQDWSWDTTRNFDNTTPVHGGSASISVTYTAAWGGLYLHTDTPISTGDYPAIEFWVNGGTSGGQSVDFKLLQGGDKSYSFTAQANTWTLVTVPLSALDNPATLSDIAWQDNGSTQPTFSLDDISLVASRLRYVMPGGTGDCSDWDHACDLQTALTGSLSGDEIWVAAGLYKPTTDPADRFATFQLKDGVALYGGFTGTETSRSQRDPAANVTILSGDIDNNDSQTPIITDTTTVTGNTTNSYHVVTGATGATLDGFTITAGDANGDSSSSLGGGMYNDYGSPILANIAFSGNSAYSSGGGMYNNSGSPALTNVTFTANHGEQGGGMINKSGSPVLTDVSFFDNHAGGAGLGGGGGLYNNSGNLTLKDISFINNNAVGGGGGLYNNSGDLILTEVLFTNNHSDGDGGGMYAGRQYSVSNNPVLTDVTFSGNNSWDYGGGLENSSGRSTLTDVTFSGNTANMGAGMDNYGSNPTLTNVTFTGNSSNGIGDGMENYKSHPVVRNTIFWNNADGGIHNGTSCSTDVSYSVVQGGCPAGSTCTNIITTDPRLGALGNYGGFTQTIPLLSGSSAIDTGNDAVCPATDQRGVTRPQGAHCDIGAYELDATAPVVNSITRLNPNPTNLASVGFSVTFSEFVTGVDVSDFSLTTAGISGASVTGVSGSGSVYTVTVNTGSGTGRLRLDVTDDDSIVDMAGNLLGGAGTGNGNFTGGETYDVRFHLIYLPLVLRN